MSQITTHILDTSVGKPARGVDVTLSQKVKGEWRPMASGTTNDDGRVVGLLSEDLVLPMGDYQLHFAIESYFQQQHVDAFYPYVDIVFTVSAGGDHYHVPLLLNPFGYSTYRGS